MTDKQKRLMALNKVKSIDKPTPEDTTVEITRFEFNLLEMTYATTTYRILEDDGTITTLRGEY